MFLIFKTIDKYRGSGGGSPYSRSIQKGPRALIGTGTFNRKNTVIVSVLSIDDVLDNWSNIELKHI